MKFGTRLLVSIGFAQGLMMGNWSRVFDPGLGYFYTHQPNGMVYAAYLLMALLTVLCFACTYLPVKARWLLIPVGFLMIDDLRRGVGLAMIPFLALTVVGIFVIFRLIKQEKTTWLKAGILSLEILGFVGIVMPLGALTLLRPTPIPLVQASKEKKSKGRIILAVFDELDPVHTLEKWPSQYPENEFIKLSRRSLYFKDCAQPGPETLYSLPALTIGKQVDKARAANNHELNLIIGGQKRTWNEEPNVLIEASKTVGASVLGWYHPYERLFPGVDAESYERITDDVPVSFWIQFDFLIERPFQWVHKNSQTIFLNRSYSHWQKEMVLSYHAKVAQFIEEHEGVILLHVPCPHGPYVMHPLPDDPIGFNEMSYFGEAAYAGEMFKTIEDTLKKTGEPYTMIVTSDHNLRIPLNGTKPCGRVPMMITGTNFQTGVQIPAKAFGEHSADLIRLLMKNPNANQDQVVLEMTKPRG